MTDKQKNLRISEAAEELNVSSSSVRRWLANGRLQGWKEGRVVRVDEEERRAEAELWREFGEALPGILGGIFGAVSAALRELPNVELASRPRMADFAEWATAAEPALGMEPGDFMEAYAGSRREVNRLALEADPVAGAVVKLMEGCYEWVGPATKLLNELDKRVDEGVRRYKTWPKQPQHLSRHLKRVAPVLRAEGIEVEDLPRKGSERPKRIFKNNLVNDRHGRHERHEPSEVHTKAVAEGDGDDDGVTVPEEKGVNERHGENPIESPDSADSDDDDTHDDEMQTTSKASFITTEAGLQALIPEMREVDVVAIDLETTRPKPETTSEDPDTSDLNSDTTGVDPKSHKIRVLSLATERGTWIVDFFAVDPRGLLDILKDKTLVIHNAMFDLLFLRQIDYQHRGRVIDTMTLSRMVYAGERDRESKRLKHTLEACCERELEVKLDKTHQQHDWSGELTEDMLAYAAEDARVLLPLREALEEKLLAADQERAVEIEERALLAGIEMAHNGVAVDKRRWLGIVEEAGKGLDGLRTTLDDLVGDPPEEVREERQEQERRRQTQGQVELG